MPLHTFSFKRGSQRGATLIELMVGITIGLLTVTVALGALMVSRGISGTVSEASQLQQQASYAFRVIGQQLRQAGSRQLDFGGDEATATSETSLKALSSTAKSPIQGADAPGDGEYALTVNFQNISEFITASDPTKDPIEDYQMRNCLQENSKNAPPPVLTSQFKRNAGTNSLVCAGTGPAEPVIENVHDFMATYLVQASAPSTTAAPKYQYVDAATAAANWSNVYAVQVCLELEGTENIDTTDTKYIKCDGSKVTRGNRLRMVFRNIYYIRNHAWLK